jgi:hypothetical protein
MLGVKFFLLAGGIGMTLAAVGVLSHDIAMEIRYRRAFATDAGPVPAIPKSRWRTAIAFGLLGWAPLMIALGIAAFGIA